VDFGFGEGAGDAEDEAFAVVAPDADGDEGGIASPPAASWRTSSPGSTAGGISICVFTMKNTTSRAFARGPCPCSWTESVVSPKDLVLSSD
jgi:hypothetical protein